MSFLPMVTSKQPWVHTHSATLRSESIRLSAERFFIPCPGEPDAEYLLLFERGKDTASWSWHLEKNEIRRLATNIAHDTPVGPGTEEPYHGVIVATPAWVAPSPPREIAVGVSFSLGAVRFGWQGGDHPRLPNGRGDRKCEVRIVALDASLPPVSYEEVDQMFDDMIVIGGDSKRWRFRRLDHGPRRIAIGSNFELVVGPE